jgi:hypothetical protein
VVFHDVSFVEATPRYEKKNKLAVRIELTDFLRVLHPGRRRGRDCRHEGRQERGHVRAGTALQGEQEQGRDRQEGKLTKHWTDWVDYWAVDFDYMSRKEIIKVPGWNRPWRGRLIARL